MKQLQSLTTSSELTKIPLEDRLDRVRISEKIEKNIVHGKTVKIVCDKVFGSFFIGDLINTFINWNQEIDEELKNKKKEILLESYFDKLDENENAIDTIKSFLGNPQGNILFNKILRILDDSPPDYSLIEQLSKVLKHIIESDFISLFEDHKYALNQIERLSPQSLSILSDNENWPLYKSSGTFDDWVERFSRVYCATKEHSDDNILMKVTHSTNSLLQNGLVKGEFAAQENYSTALLTPAGKLIANYLR